MTIAGLGSTLLPLILGLFGGQKERNPQEVFAQLNALLGAQFQPILAAAMQLAGVQGAQVGQQIAGSVGRAGGGASGVGAVTRSVGAGLASNRAADARLNVTTAQMQMLAQLFPSFMNPSMKPPGTLQNLSGAYGMSLLGGSNPLMELVNLFKGAPTTKAATLGGGSANSGIGANSGGRFFSLPEGQP